ncbi:MAG TPA: hypothetical protein VGH80_15860 [Xanthomonadaceae bacterium]
MAEPRIYCPKCKWRPSHASRWICSQRMGGCGHVWNTFLTGGLCPSCGCVWEITACLSCRQFSLHKEWYHYPDDDTPAARQVEKTEVVDA